MTGLTTTGAMTAALQQAVAGDEAAFARIVSAVLPVRGDAQGWRAGQVMAYSPDHTALLTLKAEGATAFLYPDAAVDAGGNIYVADAVSGLLKFAPGGKQVAQWSYPGGQTTAASVRVSPSGNVYTVACVDLPGDCRIAEFTPTGNLVAGWHATSTATGPGTRIDVGGHSLYLQCAGTGSPTIVWGAGGGDPGWVETAQHLLGRLASISRVCVYDGAGLGFSAGDAKEDV